MRMSARRVERLEDLHPLLEPDADLLDRGVGVHVQLVLFRRGFSAAPAPWRARGRRSRPSSAPSTTFSTTVKFSTSLKCWNTMPIPARIATSQSRDVRGSPSIRISPASAR
jgi:hypothetical protein